MSAELKVCPVEQVVGPSGENLAAFIREINGDNRMGAGALAERISEWLARAALSAACAVPVPRELLGRVLDPETGEEWSKACKELRALLAKGDA